MKNLPCLIKNNWLDTEIRETDKYIFSWCFVIKKEYVTKKYKIKKEKTGMPIPVRVDNDLLATAFDKYFDLFSKAEPINSYIFTHDNNDYDIEKSLPEQAIWQIGLDDKKYDYNAVYLGWLLYWIQREDLDKVCKIYIEPNYPDCHMLFIHLNNNPIAVLMGLRM